MTTSNGEQSVIFVYSELQIKEENEISRRVGKRFVCGNVFSGLGPKEYSKMILENELSAMSRKYPDTKIVLSGKLKNINFTNVKYELNINNY